MYKLLINSILLISMLLLSSCSIGGSRTEMLNKDNDEEKANVRLEQVLEVIKDNNKDTLKAMFSEQATNDAEDFDGNMDYLFDFFKGEVESWKKSSGPTVFESNNYGQKKKEVNSYYYVDTDKQKYFFLLRDHSVDTEHPDNVGLYLLLVVKAEDREKVYDGDQKILYDGDQKLSHAGIYIPIR